MARGRGTRVEWTHLAGLVGEGAGARARVSMARGRGTRVEWTHLAGLVDETEGSRVRVSMARGRGGGGVRACLAGAWARRWGRAGVPRWLRGRVFAGAWARQRCPAKGKRWLVDEATRSRGHAS